MTNYSIPAKVNMTIWSCITQLPENLSFKFFVFQYARDKENSLMRMDLEISDSEDSYYKTKCNGAGTCKIIHDYTSGMYKISPKQVSRLWLMVKLPSWTVFILMTKNVQNFASYLNVWKPVRKCHSKNFLQPNTIQNVVFVIKNTIMSFNFNDKRPFPFHRQSQVCLPPEGTWDQAHAPPQKEHGTMSELC